MKKTPLEPNSAPKPTLTAVIIAKNEESMIGACIETLQWCSQVLVIDTGSTDETVSIAEKFGATVISFKSNSFARVREEALTHVTSEWLFYIDADERVTPTLAKEIQVHTETNTADALNMKRKNYFFGYEISSGGWQYDVVTRVFRKNNLQGWYGDIHESPRFSGSVETVFSPLIHLTHRSVVENLISKKALSGHLKKHRHLLMPKFLQLLLKQSYARESWSSFAEEC
jgi:glycosyltransferase involved in cell wall biosynthesis